MRRVYHTSYDHNAKRIPVSLALGGLAEGIVLTLVLAGQLHHHLHCLLALVNISPPYRKTGVPPFSYEKYLNSIRKSVRIER